MTLRREAITFLRNAHTDAGGDLATVLARVVLRGAAELPGEWTRLALEVRDADPLWGAKAVTLAALVLEHAEVVSDQGVPSEVGIARDLHGTLRAEAISLLRNAHTDAGGDLAMVLARAVLRGAAELPGEWTRLALEVRDADPLWAAKSVTLAALVLEDAEPDSEQDHGKQGGGQR